MPDICWLISPVAFAVCSASAFTSDATTAKPRPASPARAASIVAFSASRLVWPAMVLISSTTSPMRLAAFDSSLTRSLVFCAWSTASLAIARRFLHLTADLVDRGWSAPRWRRLPTAHWWRLLRKPRRPWSPEFLRVRPPASACWRRLPVRSRPRTRSRRSRRPRLRTRRRVRAYPPCAARACRCFGLALLGAQPFRLDHVVLEHLDRTGHFADLVLAAETRDRRPDIAAGQPRHGGHHRGKRVRDRAADQQRQAAHQDARENANAISIHILTESRVAASARFGLACSSRSTPCAISTITGSKPRNVFIMPAS